MSLTQLLPGVWIIDDLFNQDELDDFKNIIINSENKRVFFKGYFKSGRLENKDISNLIYSKLKHLLPNTYINSNNNQFKFISPTNSIFYSEVHENERFNIHKDSGSFFDNRSKSYSKFSTLTYLNGNEDFEYGNTQFYDENLNKTISITPKKNRTLIFDIDLFHSGEIVKNVTVPKRWLGTELICKEV